MASLKQHLGLPNFRKFSYLVLWAILLQMGFVIFEKVGDILDYQPTLVSKTSFNDVKGLDDVIVELQQIVHYFQNPERYTSSGTKLPKGVLLSGPAGTGKTMLARAVAQEAGVPFFECSGKDFGAWQFGSEILPLGIRRLRKLFRAARMHSPCIVFIDDIDMIGKKRTRTISAVSKASLNQLVVELDGFNTYDGVLVIGATKFPDVLDEALVRDGRFDFRISIPKPNLKSRKDVLELYMSKILREEDVNLTMIATLTKGFSSAQLAELVDIAAQKSFHDGAQRVDMIQLDYANDKIVMGDEQKSIISDLVKRVIAFHEAGHAIVAMYVDGAPPIYKITIVPRVKILGRVAYISDRDEISTTRKELLAELDIYMGGRVAEQLIFGSDQIPALGASDLEQASHLARKMVSYYGMSITVGTVYYNCDGESSSDETKFLVEKELKTLLVKAKSNAEFILKRHVEELNALASALLDHGTLYWSQIREITNLEV